jgi:hypothetical protein
MKKIYIFTIIVITQWSFAQITITKAANDYIVGNTVNQVNLTGTPDNSATGSGATFNNGSLVPSNAITTSVTAPSAAEVTTYPGTNIKYSDGNGNNIYYKTSTTDLQITGATISGGTLNFTNNAKFIQFPTVYNQTYTDLATGTGTFNGTTVYVKGNITTTADASGTLVIGMTSTNALRLKTVQNYILYLDATFFVQIGTINSTIYSYYDNALRYPLFTTNNSTVSAPIANINETSNSAVAQTLAFLNSVDITKTNELLVYPNPTSDVVKFKGLQQKKPIVKIYSVDGKLVAEKKLNGDEINISNLSSGNYFITVSGDENVNKSVKIIKK